ncbi:MAG: UvrD-helicase domain-containing protein [candidate division WOR-3 bacterium]
MSESVVTSNQNFLLVATSAGSGKTELLARRFVYLLLKYLQNPNDLRTFLAITFTREAAREMKHRILKVLKELKELEDKNSSNYSEFVNAFGKEELKRRSQEVFWIVLENYPRVQVSTIDSFVEKVRLLILLELELLPNIELEKSIDKDLLNLALEDVLSDQQYFQEALIIALDLAEESGSFEWDIMNKLTEHIIEFKDKEDHSLAVIEPLLGYSFVRNGQPLKLSKELSHVYNNSFSNIRAFLKEGDDFENFFRLIGYRIDDFNEAIENRTKMDCDDRVNEYNNFVKTITDSPDLRDQVRAGFLQLYAPYNRIYDGAAHFYSSIFVKNYTAILNRMRRMAISDVNRKVAEYLRSPERYSSKVMSFILKYKHILIDEFQDTDPLQWDILLSFIREILSGGGSVFLVGDIKQAIYLFRNADYKIMHSLLIGEGASKYSLNQNPCVSSGSGFNFRSREKIVNFVNNIVFRDDVFERFLEESLKEIINRCVQVQKRESRLMSEIRRYLPIWVPIDQRALPENSGGFVKNIKISESDAPFLDEAYSVIEEQIRSISELGYSPGDIAILTHKNDLVREISTRLMDSGFEVVSFSSLNVVTQAAIQELISLLTALHNGDPLSALIFLTGRIFSSITQKSEDVILKEFYSELAIGGKFEIIRFIKNQSGIDLSSVKSEINAKPLYQVLLKLVNLLNLNNLEYIGPVARFLDYIFSIESRQGSITIEKLGKLLDDFLNEKDLPEELQIPLPGNVDAIKVMTFHKAKGLEFPVVINLFSPQGNKDSRKVYFLQDVKDNKVVIYPFRIRRDFLRPLTSGLFDSSDLVRLLDAYAQEKLDELVQEINVAYVAFTRAKDILINIYCENTMVNELLSKVGAKEEIGDKVSKKATSASSQAVDIRKPSLTENEKVELKIEKDFEVVSGNILTDVQSSLLGDAVHEFLQKIGCINSPSDLDNYQNLLTVIMKKHRLSAEDADRVLSMLRAFLEKDKNLDFFRCSSNEMVLKEKEIILPDGSFLRIDRVIVSPQQVKVIDFKTGSVKPEDRVQIEKYKNALKDTFPGKEVKGFLLYINSGELVEV